MAVTIIGVMSGSSLDGLDLALCSFSDPGDDFKWALEHHIVIPFPSSLKNKLATAYKLSGFDLMQLDAAFGIFIGEQIKSWLQQNQLSADLIASHGHTVFHEPAEGFTTQIGSGSHIAFATGIDTITNFRSADVAAGGQGAPFAPVADIKLFPGYDAYLNLGGIANIHIKTEDGRYKAWDIGPCNQVLNFLAKKQNQTFDLNGEIAASGEVNNEIVNALISMFPYHGGQPKGLSNASVKNTWLTYVASKNEKTADLMASAVEAIASLINSHISPLISPKANILVSGGGAHNTFLMKRINALNLNHPYTFHIPSKEIIDHKECALMAYLGYLTLSGQPYGIKDITGAAVNTIGGAIHKAV